MASQSSKGSIYDFTVKDARGNDFGGQEPGNNEQILEFACTRFKAEYPIFDQVDVNGEKAAPIDKFLKPSKGGLFGDSIKWNFSKFLVDKEGNVVDRYSPTTSPLSIEKDIRNCWPEFYDWRSHGSIYLQYSTKASNPVYFLMYKQGSPQNQVKT
ncbi:putative phospholipid hydroperoxide glutathione peroxidase [Hibiscus syriacus]|uniref:Phospholipid hydroperoxide glutathione peroxidase n=1 Tax=Hibiscus syriacus TaxID=106335 RepID=A0A6A3ARI7_HIBSY|nr:putative phospholipid hydroperoxide glutathione peroxidase [Hibiscus syriacus]